MAKLVQRRSIRRPEPEAKGPGGSFLPLVESLTLAGWLSIVAGVAYIGLQLVPILLAGSAIDVEWLGSLAAAVVLGRAATMLLPAALQLGYPRVERRNPRLFRGVVLLAVGQVVFLIAQGLGDWVISSLYAQPGVEDGLDPTFAAQAVLTLFSLVTSVMEIVGWMWVYRGLCWAGASVPRRAAATAAIGAMAVDGAAYGWLLLVYMGPATSELSFGLVVNIVAIGLGLGILGATMAVALLLVVGFRQKLLPRAAWGLGAAYGIVAAATLILGIVGMVARALSADRSLDAIGSLALELPGLAAPFLLLAACAAGLGRGTDERLDEAPRVARFWVSGERRFTAAPA